MKTNYIEIANMEELTDTEIEFVSGGVNWEGNRQSDNVIDCRSGWYCTNLSTGSILWSESFSQASIAIRNMMF